MQIFSIICIYSNMHIWCVQSKKGVKYMTAVKTYWLDIYFSKISIIVVIDTTFEALIFYLPVVFILLYRLFILLTIYYFISYKF